MATTLLPLLLSQDRFEEALEACLFARERDPLSPRVAYNVAASYLHLAQFEPAIAEARAMIALNPGLPLGYDALACGRSSTPVGRATRSSSSDGR